MLIVMSMIFPLLQLVVLGYAFGGNVKHLKLAIVDQDHGVPAVKIRELAGAVSVGRAHARPDRLRRSGPGADRPAQRRRQRRADDPAGLLAARADQQRAARRADLGQHRHLRLGLARGDGRRPGRRVQRARTPPRVAGAAGLDVVEVYPYVPYIQYLLPGSIMMSIFMMVMIGGGIIFIDDKARGLHEGYLVTPITKLELVAGFNISGHDQGGAGRRGRSRSSARSSPACPTRSIRCGCCGCSLVISSTSFALISLMFLLMVRVTDPLMPRAMFGVLNTVLYFPSGAVYPQQGFPGWMQAIAVVDPFTYAVHAFKSLLLKNTGFGAIAGDLRLPPDLLGRRDDGRDAALQADAVGMQGQRHARPASGCSTAAATAVRRARLLEGHGPRDLQDAPAPTSPP